MRHGQTILASASMRSMRVRIRTAHMGLCGLGLVWALCLAGARPCPADDRAPVFDVPRLDDIVIDGLPRDWGPKNGLRLDLLVPVAGEAKSAADHCARARLGWNERGLLLMVRVRDDTWVEEADDARLHERDAVELFLAPSVGSEQLCHWVLGSGLDSDSGTVRWHFHDRRKGEAFRDLPARIVTAGTNTFDGFVFEAMLPWRALAIEPENGREVAFQIRVNDADGLTGEPLYRAAWYPSVTTETEHGHMHRLRLADRAGDGDRLRGTAAYDLERAQTRVTVLARSDLAGREVTVRAGGSILAAVTLADVVDERAVGHARIALPPIGETYEQLSFALGPEEVDTVTLPDLRRLRAQVLARLTPAPERCVFSESTFPRIGFTRPLWADAFLGPHTLETTYYDKDYKRAVRADVPGRYGAVVKMTLADGTVHRRFFTLFRQPEPAVNWETLHLRVPLALPGSLGIEQQALKKHGGTVSAFVQQQILASFSRDDSAAVLLAGLRETKATPTDSAYYTSPDQLDRRWWVGLKRRLYRFKEKKRKRIICPLPEPGKVAPAIRRDSLKEAGMKRDAVETIDRVLSDWVAHTDEPFSVCVARHGVIVLSRTYRPRGVKVSSVPGRWPITGLDPMMTGLIMTVLAEQEFVKLDDRVDKYLPMLRRAKTDTRLTVRHLCTYTAGIHGDIDPAAKDFEERVACLLPYADVGARFDTNSLDATLAASVIEAVTGESYPDFCRARILAPLNCHHTELGDYARPARSTPADMATLSQLLLNKGRYSLFRYFKEDSFSELQPRPLRSLLGPRTEVVYGLGTVLYEGDGLGAGTFGPALGAGAVVRIDPEHDLVLVMLRKARGRNFSRYYPAFIKAVLDGIEN